MDDAKKSYAAEMLDDAKNEEEQLFEEQAVKDAALACSPETIAALRSAGEAALASLKEAAKPEVAAALEAKGKSKPGDKLFKALRKNSKTLAVVGEGVDPETDFLGGFDLDDPAYLSEEFRKGGCSAVSALSAEVEGALGDGAIAATVSEQNRAKGEFPGPLPAIARGLVIDELQLAAAKAEGAAGVVLSLALNGKDKTAELMASAGELGLETVVRVTNAEQLSAALELDAKIVAIGDCTFADASALLASLPEAHKEGPITVSDLAFLDVRGAWKLRDAGFNALFAGRSLLDVCVRDRVPPTAICKAILSKGSVKYGLGMQKGRLEGSKEFLGSMAM